MQVTNVLCILFLEIFQISNNYIEYLKIIICQISDKINSLNFSKSI